MLKQKNILICPLQWGLGHAGRMIPVALELMASGNNVYIASVDEHFELFRNETEGLKFVFFPGFRITYSRWLPQYVKITLKAPSFIYHTIREHRLLKKIIRDYAIDIVISDSRPGLWNRSITTVLVTHMLRVPYPAGFRFLENLVLPVVRRIISKFNYCFVPDLPGEINLSGKLSHGIEQPGNVRFIGILSRFSNKNIHSKSSQCEYFCTVILSGPEPQRGLLRQKLSRILASTGKSSVILEGRPGRETLKVSEGNILSISHLNSDEMMNLIMRSKFLISRSGYTTLMELVSLGRSALIIPTPGQSEQEYLASLMKERGWFTTVSQNDLADDILFPVTGISLPAGINEQSRSLLKNALKELLE